MLVKRSIVMICQRHTVQMIDLKDVTAEDDLGALAGPGDDGLDLVGGKVLGLVDDQEDLHK